MFVLVLRGMSAHRWRALLTATAVLLGVTMIAGTYVFTDTINRAFHQIFTDAATGADAVVSGRSAIGGVGGTEAPTVPQSLADRIARLPGVARQQGQISDHAALLGSNGRPISIGGSPTIAVSYTHPPFESLRVIAGTRPRRHTEVAIDEETAAHEHVHLGQTVKIATQGPARPFTVVGLVRFGGATLGGATYLVFNLATAERLFLKAGQLDYLYLQVTFGTTPARLVREIRPLLPRQLQIRTATAQVRENASRFTAQLSFLTDGLLAFGFIATFVGAFVIFNAFSITVAQRAREFALLRTLGATRRQVLGSVVAESAIIGVVASAAGVALGFLGAKAIRALFAAADLKLPSTTAVLQTRTVLVSMLVGILVTVIAGLLPAVRATRIPPVAGLREGFVVPRARLAFLVPWLGALLAAGGGALTLYGLSESAAVGPAAAGAILLAVGVAVLSARLVPLAARLAGWPLERLGALVGRLARESASRNPGRTAVTAASLMIGLTVVLFVTIFANGARLSVRHLIARSFTGDLAVVHQDGSSPIPVASARAVASVPGVQTVSVFKSTDSHVGGAGSQSANGFDPLTVQAVYHFDWVEGSDEVLGLMGPQGTLIEQRLANRAHLHVGDFLDVRTPAGQRTRLLVRGVYRDRYLLTGFAMGLPAFTDLFHQQSARQLLIKLTPGARPARVEPAVNAALRAFPEARARSQRQLADDQAAKVNQVLYLFYALLAVSVIVSLFGLVNTLTLSVYERTRELGMLRAVGMSRRQLRRSVRYESVITAALGTALGLLLGLFFSAVVTAALSDQGIVFAVPWSQLAGLVALTLALGVLAAIPPARRAARVDVLRALAYE